MKKKLNKTLILTSIVCILPVILSLAVYRDLPAQVPTHWGIDGNANGFSPRWVAAFGIPFGMLILNIIVNVVLDSDPKRANASKALILLGKWSVPVICAILLPISLFKALGFPIPIHVVVPIIMSILFLVCGNYLPKCKQNYTAGIRLPWTLNNEENWNKTHQLAGYVWTSGGLVCLLGTLFGVPWILFFVIILMVTIPAVYSYSLYRASRK